MMNACFTSKMPGFLRKHACCLLAPRMPTPQSIHHTTWYQYSYPFFTIEIIAIAWVSTGVYYTLYSNSLYRMQVLSIYQVR